MCVCVRACACIGEFHVAHRLSAGFEFALALAEFGVRDAAGFRLGGAQLRVAGARRKVQGAQRLVAIVLLAAHAHDHQHLRSVHSYGLAVSPLYVSAGFRCCYSNRTCI